MYKHLFGPVPSRRLGMSLGIDMVTAKTCSLDCVYCEVGKTTNLTVERKEYVNEYEIREELNDFFSINPDPDYITLGGSGEPTLNSCIGNILKYIKHIKPGIPSAVLTNGTLLTHRDIREALKNADVVLPSFDAATDSVFRKINRPEQSLNINSIIEGLIDFRKEYKGKIWLEIFILPDYNDSEDELLELKKAVIKMKPDIVQLNSLDRPGNVSGLRKASRRELEKIIEFWGIPNAEIIAAAPDRKHIRAYRADTESAILETISRRPCTLDDLERILGMHRNEINKYLDVLESENRIESIEQERGVFYQTKQ